MRIRFACLLSAFLALASVTVVQADELTVTFAGKIWSESLVQEFMAAHAEKNPNYRNSLITTDWKLVDCNKSPYKYASDETRHCLEGPIYQGNDRCRFKQYMLVIINDTEETLVSGNFSFDSRCGLYAYNPTYDVVHIKYPLQFIRPLDAATEPQIVKNAVVIGFTSASQPCLGFRDYGRINHSGVYTFTTTGHICRKNGVAFEADEIKQKLSAIYPTLLF